MVRVMSAVYVASPIKRQRATKAEMLDRRAALLNIVAEGRPMTVRQVFYQATVHGIVEKAETGYNKVQTLLADMRRDGDLPYDWLADSTRWMRKPETFDSVEDALRETARFYRRNLWRDAVSYAEVWLEKDALSGVVYPITSMYDVPLMVARGFASLSFLHEAAEAIKHTNRPTFIYHLGDYDPSGVEAARKIEQTLREFAPDAEIYFERLAVLPSQIMEWDLPTRPTKTTDSRAKNFGDKSVELDAIEPGQLRQIVEEAINRHIPQDELRVLKQAEASERNLLDYLVQTGIRSMRPTP